MKTLKVVALGTVAALSVTFSSCGSQVSTDVTLKTDTDSLSYAYGVSYYQQMLSRQLEQMGLMGDTVYLSSSYVGRINAETDDAQKAKLTKEMKTKIDSVTRANEKNLAAFLGGFQEGMKASKAEEARIMGLVMGSQTSKQMFPGLVQHLYGEGAEVKDHFSEAMFTSGVVTAMKGKKAIIENPDQFLEAKIKEIQSGKYKANQEAGEKFLAENKTKEGVVTLESGVQYKVVKEANGAKPGLTDRVKVHYHGTLVDGKVFDSSVDRGEPATFGVNQVIAGWTEVLQLMPVGSKWQVYIPYDKAYGTDERGGDIKPYSALIFDVELLSIEK